MSKFPSFLLGMVAGAMLLYAAINFHVVRARDGFHFIAKQPPRLGEFYIDIRGFGVSDWAGRPQLTAALAEANEQRLLPDSAIGAIQEGANQLLPRWPDASATR